MPSPKQRWDHLIRSRKLSERQDVFTTSSDISVEPFYPTVSGDVPGEFPFTRGVHPTMYRGKVWTMRMYAGFATAEESNARYRDLIAQGGTGLSVAFDLPTQMGLDSDDVRARGEVGKAGVAIDTLDDMRRLFAEIDLATVSTSMTINAPAGILLAMYQAVAEEGGVSAAKLSGTIQNDILKEYAARGTYIFPPTASMRLITDIFAYCQHHLPKWNTISISGYHIREAGATAVQEVAFTLANGLAYVSAAQQAGLQVNDFAPRLSFFFNAHNLFFEEIAKFRAARRLWAKLMRERFQAEDAACALRFHTQTAGSTLTAQQTDNNVVRVAYQALAAVLGGTQSLHTNSRDEALALPTEDSARLALRTQQVLAYETGVADTIDPLAGAPFIENLTDEIEARALELIQKIDERGGAVQAIESGFVQTEIQNSAFLAQKNLENKKSLVVGVNCFVSPESFHSAPKLLKVSEKVEREQIDRLKAFKAKRSEKSVEEHFRNLEAAAMGGTNLMPVIHAAVRGNVTLGEICHVLKKVFGEYHENFT